jgi:hypothetical protein
MKTIDRYLLREMGGPFLFGVLAFVLLFVSAQILFELMELVNTLGISLWTAGYLFVLWLPAFVVYTFPLATLVAILISFGRLSGESPLPSTSSSCRPRIGAPKTSSARPPRAAARPPRSTYSTPTPTARGSPGSSTPRSSTSGPVR